MDNNKLNSIRKMYCSLLMISILSISILLNIGIRLISVINYLNDESSTYYLTNSTAFYLFGLYAVLLLSATILPKVMNDNDYGYFNCKIAVWGCLISIVGAFYSDILYMIETTFRLGNATVFSPTLLLYLRQESWFYISLSLLIVTIILFKKLLYTDVPARYSVNTIKLFFVTACLLCPLIVVYPLPIINVIIFKIFNPKQFIALPVVFVTLLNGLYTFISILLLSYAFLIRAEFKIPIEWLKLLTKLVGLILVFTTMMQLVLDFIPYKILSSQMWLSRWQIIELAILNVKDNAVNFIPLIIFCLFISLFLQFIKRKQFDEIAGNDQTSGNFGSASYAIPRDLERINAFTPENGPFIGTVNNRALYLPLYNKLTISPPGGGKTTSSSIPMLLVHDGPVFVFDIKGELWAVTARYRSEVLGRHVVVIDPFGVTKSDDFRCGKPKSLLKDYKLNPFDWIPEDNKQRDRMINAFAASFVINEGGFATHFDENAKILIRGYIDYLMSREVTMRGLPMLYQLMSESMEQAQNTFDQMSQLEGRAGAAANQINRVGSDERGSILSTSYRQIDWMGDSNIQETLSESNFDLRDFLKGNMDIFVVLPEDQVKEHSRLFRMIMSLLMSMIVQANPSDLPKKKMLFLLEELAQLGASPDVEQCIEVMRIRGVIVWTVFQALKQIEMFSKPDLFLSVPLKQIFTNDDVQTMQWIQTLGGKKTVLTKTLSNNKGDSRQKMQVFGGSISNGEGESVHETGVDLIQINEIRELPKDEQFVFLHGSKPIRCKKVRYFEYAAFSGRYDPNPLEAKSFF